MTLRIDFTEAEIVDVGLGDLRARVKCFDDSAVEVEIRGCDNAESWAELAAAVAQCIKLMDLKPEAAA